MFCDTKDIMKRKKKQKEQKIILRQKQNATKIRIVRLYKRNIISQKTIAMNRVLKQVIIWFLILLIIVFTVIAILGIWDVIDMERVVRKLLETLVVVFASGAVILFIFSVVGKEIDQER